MALDLPRLETTEKLSTSVIRILGGNPSKFTLQGSNTYLLGTGPERILLDTGEGRDSWRDALSSTLKSESCTVTTALLSHWHHDHIGGVSALRALHPNTSISVHKHNPTYDPGNSQLDTSKISPITDGQRFRTPSGFEVQALHTPGHTTDHMCFVVTASASDPSEVGAIFTADNVLGHGTAVFEDLATYLSSLHIMKDAVSRSSSPVKAFPGHGAAIPDALAKISEYIEHRRMREQEALNVLKYGTPTPPPTEEGSEAADVGALEVIKGKEWGSMEMVKVIYRHYPENLWEPAEKGLLMVLAKLEAEGRVERGPQGGWIVLEKAAL
ncbi:uncharacterized protein HMPREF1541_00233 [Cyphellophora europaea CBS 101466]|uniref:Metallo-beta-lactamase domain-containing protein n=1 Tax=Cyphellophora europaea (strain CBS 101466) TaxID=1220924 RepID=W2SBR2_CYPE1|nr:uncharacterized protein HMPREF1541_00233 [Cyphellophora europaea CBS 101466]ETN46050.1 hypothetical protein HMPREF1541_00233 [Cyphellophora europaea CBS 101466]